MSIWTKRRDRGAEEGTKADEIGGVGGMLLGKGGNGRRIHETIRLGGRSRDSLT